MMYKLLNNPMTGQPSPFVLRIADNAFIPINESNTDYQAYLKYIAEGGAVLPASSIEDATSSGLTEQEDNS